MNEEDAGGELECMKAISTLVSRNITVLGRRTSVRLEPEMWNALKEIARREGCKIHDLCSLIHVRKNPDTSLTAAIRVFLMLYYRAAATEEGHARARHGNFEVMLQRAKMSTDLLASLKKPGKNNKLSELPCPAYSVMPQHHNADAPVRASYSQ